MKSIFIFTIFLAMQISIVGTAEAQKALYPVIGAKDIAQGYHVAEIHTRGALGKRSTKMRTEAVEVTKNDITLRCYTQHLKSKKFLTVTVQFFNNSDIQYYNPPVSPILVLTDGSDSICNPVPPETLSASFADRGMVSGQEAAGSYKRGLISITRMMSRSRTESKLKIADAIVPEAYKYSKIPPNANLKGNIYYYVTDPSEIRFTINFEGEKYDFLFVDKRSTRRKMMKGEAIDE